MSSHLYHHTSPTYPTQSETMSTSNNPSNPPYNGVTSSRLTRQSPHLLNALHDAFSSQDSSTAFHPSSASRSASLSSSASSSLSRSSSRSPGSGLASSPPRALASPPQTSSLSSESSSGSSRRATSVVGASRAPTGNVTGGRMEQGGRASGEYGVDGAYAPMAAGFARLSVKDGTVGVSGAGGVGRAMSVPARRVDARAMFDGPA